VSVGAVAGGDEMREILMWRCRGPNLRVPLELLLYAAMSQGIVAFVISN
jgi:hypothetical protein